MQDIEATGGELRDIRVVAVLISPLRYPPDELLLGVRVEVGAPHNKERREELQGILQFEREAAPAGMPDVFEETLCEEFVQVGSCRILCESQEVWAEQNQLRSTAMCTTQSPSGARVEKLLRGPVCGPLLSERFRKSGDVPGSKVTVAPRLE